MSTLFDPRTHARTDNPPTSKQAAAAASLFAGKQADRIALAVDQAGERGATAHEIAAATGLTPQQVGRRIGDLVAEGRIRRDGRQRRNPLGLQEMVHVTNTKPFDGAA